MGQKAPVCKWWREVLERLIGLPKIPRGEWDRDPLF